ncbi:hypothetical protein FAF44_31225 [Nonomuraea sp. MG754425]|uniref:hypothetical protein n=1 Tax=Nonomuraea sp. MG754425 TaxID=2570319 RepID=UPI001F482F22|nr:hypothetical protein [Nonomuraea sp. MG754425]MCF6472834.1 hypothetical protein [Nonomuraea sp. MG754425]
MTIFAMAIVSAVCVVGLGESVGSGGSGGSGASGANEAAGREPPGPSRKLGAAELRLLDRAEQALIAACMRDQGFRYVSAEPARKNPQDRTFRFVIDDVSWAERHGLGTQDRLRAGDDAAMGPNEQYARGLSKAARAAYGVALMGPPPAEQRKPLEIRLPHGEVVGMSGSGCVAEARTELYGDLRAWFRSTMVLNNLTPFVAAAIEKDSAYRVSLKNWAACMRGAGHPYENPGELRAAAAKLIAGRDPDAAHRIEVPLAVAEARCAQRTGLGAAISGVERREWAALARLHRPDIETLRRLRLGALDRARHVVAAG